MESNAPASVTVECPSLPSLFLIFARVSLLTIGGGYVMFPLLKREVVDSKRWISNGELVDFYALGQSVPGIIAMNTAALIGFRKRGLPGAIASAAGMALPSVITILLIAACLTPYFDLPWVQKAFVGVRAAVVALIAAAVWQVGRSSVNSLTKAMLAALSFLAIAFLGVSPVLLIVTGGLLGLLLFRREEQT